MKRTIGLSIAVIGLLVGVASAAPPTASEDPPTVTAVIEAPTLDVSLVPAAELELAAPTAEAERITMSADIERIQRHRIGTRIARAHAQRGSDTSPSNPSRASPGWGHRYSAART